MKKIIFFVLFAVVLLSIMTSCESTDEEAGAVASDNIVTDHVADNNANDIAPDGGLESKPSGNKSELDVSDGKNNTVEYVKNSNGLFVYSDCGFLESDSQKNDSVVFVSADKIGLVKTYMESLDTTIKELEGEKEFKFGGDELLVRYAYSKRISDEYDNLATRHGNVDIYRDEFGGNYVVSCYTKEIIEYYFLDGCVAKGNISADDALNVATAFLNKHIKGIDLSQYVLHGPTFNYASDGRKELISYRLTLRRQLHGFDTNECINMVIAMNGDVCVYINYFAHMYDGVDDIVSEEEITDALYDLRKALLKVHITIDMNSATILTDSEGKLYLRVLGRDGNTYYSEIVLKN